MNNRGRLRALISAWLSPPEKKEFQLVRRGGLIWYVRSSFSGPDLNELLDDPNAVIDESGVVLRDKGMSKTAASGGFVIKRNPARKWSEVLKAFFRKSPGLRAFFKAFRLEAAGVRTAVPVAACEKRTFRVLSSSYFVMEQRQSAVALDRWDGDRARLAIRLGRLIGRLHAMKCSHRDLKAANILVDDSGEPFLIDMEGVRFWWRLPLARVRGDLERFQRASRELRCVDAAHRSLFILAYCRERGIRPSRLRMGIRLGDRNGAMVSSRGSIRLRWIEPKGEGRRELWLLIGPRSIDVRAKARAHRRVNHLKRRSAWLEVVRRRDRRGFLLWKWIKPDALPVDYWRRYWGRSRAAREIRGLRILRRAGLLVPGHHCSGFAVNPFSEFESFLVIDYCDGTVSGHRFLRDCRDSGVRKRFLLSVAGDLKTMVRGRVSLKDLHLGNVLVNPDRPERIYWIDSDVKAVRSLREGEKWLERAIERLLVKAFRWGLEHCEEALVRSALEQSEGPFAPR